MTKANVGIYKAVAGFAVALLAVSLSVGATCVSTSSARDNARQDKLNDAQDAEISEHDKRLRALETAFVRQETLLGTVIEKLDEIHDEMKE